MRFTTNNQGSQPKHEPSNQNICNNSQTRIIFGILEGMKYGTPRDENYREGVIQDDMLSERFGCLRFVRHKSQNDPAGSLPWSARSISKIDSS